MSILAEVYQRRNGSYPSKYMQGYMHEQWLRWVLEHSMLQLTEHWTVQFILSSQSKEAGSEAAGAEVLDEETEVEGGSSEGGLYNIFKHPSTQLQVCHMPASLLFWQHQSC